MVVYEDESSKLDHMVSLANRRGQTVIPALTVAHRSIESTPTNDDPTALGYRTPDPILLR
jgi:hypothetical protein